MCIGSIGEVVDARKLEGFFECWSDARADIWFVSFLFNNELLFGNTPSWRTGSMKRVGKVTCEFPELQELRELRHDWAKEQMSRVFLAKLTRKMLKHWMFYKSVWSWSSNLDDSCVKTLQKSVTLFHKRKTQVHWNIISHLSMMGYFDDQLLKISCQEALLRETGEAERSLVRRLGSDRSKWFFSFWTASRGRLLRIFCFFFWDVFFSEISNQSII